MKGNVDLQQAIKFAKEIIITKLEIEKEIHIS